MFCKKIILKIFSKSIVKHLCRSFSFNKNADLGLQLFNGHVHICFPVNFEKLIIAPLFIEHFWCLLLYYTPNEFLTTNQETDPIILAYTLKHTNTDMPEFLLQLIKKVIKSITVTYHPMKINFNQNSLFPWKFGFSCYIQHASAVI